MPLRAKVDSLELDLAGGHLRGEFEVDGLVDPRRVSFELQGEGIDLDRLGGPAAGEGHGPAAPGRPARALELQGKLRLTSGRYGGAPLRDLVLDLGMVRSVVTLKTLRAEMLGGRVEASGSSVDLGQEPARFSLRTRLEHINLSEVPWEQLAPRLTGELGMTLTEGRLKSVSLGEQVVDPMLQRANGAGRGPRRESEMALDRFAGRFRIQGGRLHTKELMTFTSSEGTVALSGSIGLDQSLSLGGQLDVPPRVIEIASEGRMSPAGPVPVYLRVGGTLKVPKVEVVNLDQTLGVLGEALLRGGLKALLRH